MVSFKSKYQQISKLKETIKIEEEDPYNDFLRLWNITANIGENKTEINKLKDGIEAESSFDTQVHYQVEECYNKLSRIPSSAPGKMKSSINKIQYLNVGTSKRKKYSQNSKGDESLFCNEVKFGIVYTCCYCENVFSSKHSLAKHKRKHNFCQYCKAKLKTLKALTNHRKNCIFEKCMTSYPRVELINIALSRKMRTLYKSAFSKESFPYIKCSTFDIKKEVYDSNACNSNLEVNENEIDYLKEGDNFALSNSFNNIVKFEPIEYEDNTECFGKNNTYSIFQNTADNFVKLEAIDIVEDQLINENLSTCIKEEFILDNSQENYVMNTDNSGYEFHPDLITKIDNKFNNTELSMNIDPISSPDLVINSEKSLERRIHASNESLLSEGDSYSRTTRFCRFKSEILPQPETQYKFAYEFVRHDYNIIKNQYIDCMSSKDNCNNSEKSSVQTETQKLDEEQSKFIVSDIPCSNITSDQCNHVIKSKSETKDAESVSSDHMPIKESKLSSTKAENEKIITQPIKPEIKDNSVNLVASKTLTLPKTNIPHTGKTSYLQRVKYVRFTNRPNLNLFMF